VLFVFITYGALFALIRSGSSRGASGGFMVILLLPLAHFGLLWAMAAKGSSPGKAMHGIRVVRESSGAFPGAGLLSAVCSFRAFSSASRSISQDSRHCGTAQVGDAHGGTWRWELSC
jgi:hypothetical protein